MNVPSPLPPLCPPRAPKPARSLHRLLLAYQSTLLLLLLLVAVLGALWAYFWYQSSRESLRLNAMTYLTQQIRGDLYAQVKQVNRARLLEEPTALARYDDVSAQIDARFDTLQTRLGDAQERLVVDYLRRIYQTVRVDMDNVRSDPYRVGAQRAVKLLDADYDEWMLAEFESALLIVERIIEQRRAQLDASVGRWTGVAVWLVPLVAVFAIALLVRSWRSVQRGFVRPMRELTAATRLADGRPPRPALADAAAVAEVQRLAAALNALADELDASRAALLASERQAALGALVPAVAHNIRNPLASIRAAAQVLDADDPDDLADVRGAIIDTVDRLARWVGSLLNYLHPLEPRPQPAALADVVDGALRPLHGRIRDKRLRVERHGWQRRVDVAVDIDLLEQALYGLLNNAVEASPPASRLRLTLAVVDGGEQLTISDRGPGMAFEPPTDEPAPGLTPGPTTKRYGTGLGIPFAIKICQAHAGRLRFETPPDGGTAVRLWLPLVPEPAAPAAEAASA